MRPPLLDLALLTMKEAEADLPCCPVRITWADANTEHGSTHGHLGAAGAGGTSAALGVSVL